MFPSWAPRNTRHCVTHRSHRREMMMRSMTFFRETIIAVPGPMMDLLARKPGVSDAQVCASAERQEAFAIVVGCSVDEYGAINIRPVSASVSRESCLSIR